jgi:hypothetical protein
LNKYVDINPGRQDWHHGSCLFCQQERHLGVDQ